MLKDKIIKPDNFRRIHGSNLTVEWLNDDISALSEPIVIEEPEGLGMSMPSSEFTVSDVAEIVGSDTPVEVMGKRLSATQIALTDFALNRCCDAIECPWLQPCKMG